MYTIKLVCVLQWSLGLDGKISTSKCKRTLSLCARQEYQKPCTLNFVTGCIYDHCLVELREEDNADRPNEYIETCIGRSAPLAKVSESYPPPLHISFQIRYVHACTCIANWVFFCFLSNSFHFFSSYM